MRKYIDIRDLVALGARTMESAVIHLEGVAEYTVDFTRQKTGYGEKLFLLCPLCGSRREKLYMYRGGLLCRECYPLPVYRSIKNLTMGSGAYIVHRMVSLAKREEIPFKRFPFCYLDYEKPKYRHFEKWHMAVMKLQALENMRNQAIFFKKRYSLDTINSVLEGKNQYLYVLALYDVNRNFYNWDVGCCNSIEG